MMLDSSGIRAFMTNAMKDDLRACGFTEEQLAKLTPQEGDEILAATNTIAPNSDELRKMIEIIVTQARRATAHLKEPGLLQVSRIHPLDDSIAFSRYALIDPKLVERITKEALEDNKAGHGVFIEGRTVRRGLKGKDRGQVKDTIAVFASVVDSDADKGEAWTPNVPVSLGVETSPGNGHPWLFWEKALDPEIGQAFGDRLRAATKTGTPTGTITQPYRLAGSINYPTDKKRNRGRVEVLARILNYDPTVLWTPEKFEQAFPKSEDVEEAEPSEAEAPIERIALVLAVIPHNDSDPHEPDYWKQIGHTPGRTYMVQIGMAVKAASGGSDDGFAVFDKWRSGAPDYNPATTRKKWNGFKPTKIGFGTLKFYGDKAKPGWDKNAVDVEVERLAKLSEVQYELEREPTAKKLGIRITFLDKLVADAQIKLALAAPAAKNKLAQMNAKNCVVLDGGRTRVLRFEEVEHDAGGEHYVYRVPTFLRFEDFRNLYLSHHIMVGKKSVDLGSWWLEHPQRLQYPSIVFKPGGQHIINGKLNLWRGWGVTPRPGDWGYMREHIFRVIAARDTDVDTYTMKWLAWSVQHADQQAGTALVFLGERGTGRSTLGTTICKLFGPQHSRHISSSDHLVGKFNQHLRQCAFLFADEAYAPDDKKAKARMNRNITEPTLDIEPKGRDMVEVPNLLHVMLAANEDWAVPAGEHERRYVVQHVANTYRQNQVWFDPIYTQLRNGGYEAMLFELLSMDLGDWHPRQIIRTAALADQQEQSLAPFDAWWFHVLQTGVLGGTPNPYHPDRAVSNQYEEEVDMGSDRFGNSRTRIVKRDGLYTHARRISPKLKNETEAAFGRYIRKQGAVDAWVSRRRGWQFPSLAECRKRWLERFPQTQWRDVAVKNWRVEDE